jgi:hypothetical protein
MAKKPLLRARAADRNGCACGAQNSQSAIWGGAAVGIPREAVLVAASSSEWQALQQGGKAQATRGESAVSLLGMKKTREVFVVMVAYGPSLPPMPTPMQTHQQTIHDLTPTEGLVPLSHHLHRNQRCFAHNPLRGSTTQRKLTTPDSPKRLQRTRAPRRWQQ